MRLADVFPMTAEQQKLIEALYVLHRDAVLNVTAIKDEEMFHVKHLIDSVLYFHEHMKAEDLNGKTLADIGTGGGFPGIVLAICYPLLQVTLVDSIRKKCDFLQECIDALGLKNASMLNARAEDMTGTYDIITARGVAKVKEMVKWTLHLAHQETRWVLYKGEALEEELQIAKNYLKKKELSVEKVRYEHPIQRTYCCLAFARSSVD